MLVSKESKSAKASGAENFALVTLFLFGSIPATIDRLKKVVGSIVRSVSEASRGSVIGAWA